MVSSISVAVTPATQRVLGLVVWVVALVAVPAPLQERILLLAPLVVVPTLLAVLPSRPVLPGVGTTELGPWAMSAAVLLPLAVALPRGPVSGGLVLPWLAFATLLALAGIRDGLGRLPGIVRSAHAADLATDGALVGLVVGAGWLWLDRLGLAVPGIPPIIVTLTAVHFHFAAVGLVGVAALLGVIRPGRVAWVASMGLIVGTCVTAAGFLVASEVGWLGAIVVGSSGLLLAATLAGARPTPVVRVACVALALGMALAIAWPTSLALAPGLLDIDVMVRTHGILNATAVTLLAWTAHAWMEAAR